MNTFIKGMTTGICVGVVSMAIIEPLSSRQKHRLKKKTKGFFKDMGAMIDSAISNMH